MSKLLKTKEIETKLKKLDVHWSALSDGTLNRVYEFDDFKSALGFVIKIGVVAEKFNHHPDIKLSWGRVELSISTHSAGGLTPKDFNLASAIEKLA